MSPSSGRLTPRTGLLTRGIGCELLTWTTRGAWAGDTRMLFIPAWLLGILAVCASISAAILVVKAMQRPFIGALTERAIIGVLLAFFGVLSTIVAWDTELGRVILSTDEARFVNRLAILIVLAIPTVWLLLYATNRLGDDGQGSDDSRGEP
jgi:hypothetical protein